MKLNYILGVVLIGMFTSFTTQAADQPIDIKSDIKSKYFLVEKTGNPNLPTLLLKRVKPSGKAIYTKKEFDCGKNTVRYLGSGESKKEMTEDTADSKGNPVRKDSINEQLARIACSK